MAHVVENHPQRKYIIDALLCGRPLRQIAGTLQPSVSIMALQRYKAKIVKPALSNAVIVAKVSGKLPPNGKTIESPDLTEDEGAVVLRTATNVLRNAPITDPYLARIQEHQRTIDAAIGFACDNEDPRSVAALVATDLKGIELDARLTGRLDHDKPNQSISLAVMVNIPRAIPDAPKPIPAIDVSFSSPDVDKP